MAARIGGAVAAFALVPLTPLMLASARRGEDHEVAARRLGVGLSSALAAGGAALLTPASLPTAARIAIAGAAAIGGGIVSARLGATRGSEAPLEPWKGGNGCGEGRWNVLVPNFGFDEACDEHDRYYLKRSERDGTPTTRRHADSRMLEDGVRQVEERFGEDDPRRYVGIAAASTYYGVVRVVAAPWWGEQPKPKASANPAAQRS